MLFFVILFIISCSKQNDLSSNSNNKSLARFTVTVVDRAPYTAIITWTEALNINNSDTVKYDIVLNGKQVRSGLIRTIDTLKNLSPDSSYKGQVLARSISGDTASATFELEKISGYIVFGDDEGSLRCLNIYTGSSLWKTAPTSRSYFFSSTPVIVDSTIYISTNMQGVFAINAKTGAQKWNNNFGQTGSTFYTNNLVLQGDRIYTVNGANKIYSVNSTNGQTIWSYSEASYTYDSHPVIGNNLLFEFATGPYKKIVAINTINGTKIWEFITNCFVCKNPVLYNNLLIFGGSDGKVYALNQATGSLVWSRNFYDNSNFGAHYVSPKVYNNIVIVHSGVSGYYGLNASTGTTVWNYNAASTPNISSPTIGNGLMYFAIIANPTSKAIALNAATGVKVWEYTFGPATDCPTPIFAKNRLYFGNNLTLGYGIPVLDATKGTFITILANSIYQHGPETVVAGDSTFYISQSGMVQ